MSDTQEATAMAPLLGRSAHALSDLRLRLGRVEHELEALFQATGHALQPRQIGALQEIDVVVQSLDALAGVLERLSIMQGTDEQSVLSAVEGVPLRDLARRLRGASPSVQGEPGEMEFF